MALTKPYYRIIRPGPNASIHEFVTDSRYAPDRISLVRAYLSIQKTLQDIFDYIEPADQNKDVFSHELYALLLRACTEVEANFKSILVANGMSGSDHFNMGNYKKIEESSKLSNYKVTFPFWRKLDGNVSSLEMIPFESFQLGNSPEWYVAYNNVKHNRDSKFENASLKNCMNAVAAVLVLLYSQFGAGCLAIRAGSLGFGGFGLNEYGYDDLIFCGDTDFQIIPPSMADWPDAERYDFNWDSLKDTAEPFEKYPFTTR